MKNIPPVVAIDAGRSAVKVAYASGPQRGDFVFPSVVIPARELSNEQTALNAARETVTVDGQKYFVGQTAMEQSAGASYVGHNDDWTSQPEYKALIASAMDRIEQRGVEFHAEPIIVVGAPSNVYASQRQQIATHTKAALRGDFAVKVLPQAAGVYYSHVFNADGSVNGQHMFRNGVSGQLRNYGVVDPGHFSTDYILFVNGNVNESTFTSTGGVFEAYEELGKIFKEQRITASASKLTEALLNGEIFVYGRSVDVRKHVQRALVTFIESIRSKTERLFASYAQELDGILIGGGGGPLINTALEACFPHAMLVPNPRMAVVNGYLAIGLAQAARSKPAIVKAA